MSTTLGSPCVAGTGVSGARPACRRCPSSNSPAAGGGDDAGAGGIALALPAPQSSGSAAGHGMEDLGYAADLLSWAFSASISFCRSSSPRSNCAMASVKLPPPETVRSGGAGSGSGPRAAAGPGGSASTSGSCGSSGCP
eukprot:CAMPEP_0175441358 /NCGR_PEP_ID=MMETSP0095-20121207/57553_1 /TAXON_ID=311494 /ORGANISM="Alexandrium monilatum, Strain CCMP3105" /LENGTH=138 /DNA_ID=CAMNT_0016741277 /DNA_START=208 /DNA_END=621 /DNA_ORIENTATION=+